MMSCISYSDELEDSETVASICQRRVFDNGTSDMNCKSSATCSERIPYIDVISESTHPERKSNINNNSFSSNVNNNSFNITLGQYDDDSAMESFQGCWNGDVSENCNDVETRLTVKDICGLSISRVVNPESTKDDPPFCRSTADSCVSDDVPINDCHACDPYLSEDGGRTGSAERAEFGQACSSNNFHAVSSGKGGRRTRKAASRTGNDNSRSVWKRVQKMDTEHCVNKKKDAHAISLQVDFLSKDTDTRSIHDISDGPKKHQREKNGRYSCKYEMNKQTSKSYSYKIASTTVDSSEINGKRKPTSSLKQVNHYSRKEIPNVSAVLSKSSKPQVQKDKLRILPELNEAKVDSSSGLNSPCSTDSQLLVIKPTENCDVFQSGQPQKNTKYSDEGSLSENLCSTSGRMTLAVIGNQTDTIAALDSLGHTPIEVHSNIRDHKRWHQDISPIDCTDGKHRNMQAECAHAEYHEPDNKFGTVLQKWVPVGGKEIVVSSASPTDSIKPSLICKSAPNKADTKCADKEATRFHYGVPLARRETHCSNNSTADLSCLSLQTDKCTGELRCDPCTAGEFVGMLECSSHLSNKVECQELSKSKSDLYKIIHAVNNVYSSQATEEAVNQVYGTPIAKIERFIRSTSPVICQSSHNRNCRTFFSEQIRNDSRCWHQNYDITLGSLWQWYEEPGCYGLEVKAEERCNSRSLHNEFFEFKAYFVPYLSAVQLFRRPGLSNASSQGETLVSHEAHKAAKTSSELASFPIFSKLFPQPYKESDASLLCSSLKVESDNQSVRLANSSDEEIIFEYFEHAQPPQRSPLLKKIKELVNGDKSSDSQIYGDPSKLECMKLCDLHSASWYSVAWYPIYRIPEGNFRSAFLTYHSLGRFIHQSASPSSADDFTHLVSPVVGLQSYNAKKECWFLPRISKFKEVQEELLSSNTPKLVEERLRTLEHTAAVMATATVIKGHQRCANNHPDYNHFLSRW